MITLTIGLTPYFKINEHWAVNIDYSYRLHFNKTDIITWISNDYPLGAGYMRTLSVGIVIISELAIHLVLVVNSLSIHKN